MLPRPLIRKIALPNTSSITNNYDNVGRLLTTSLRSSSGTDLDSYTYVSSQNPFLRSLRPSIRSLLTIPCALALLGVFRMEVLGLDVTKALPDKAIVAACLDEADGQALLRSLQMTNCYIELIERDSSGTAVFFEFNNLDATNQHRTLVLRADGAKLLPCTPETYYEHFFDDLKIAWFDQGDLTVFPSGDKFRWKSMTLHSAPGNEFLVMQSHGAQEQRIVKCRNPTQTLFSVRTNELHIRTIFSTNTKVYLFGLKPQSEQWVCRIYEDSSGWPARNEISLPDVLRVLDFHPASGSVLCMVSGPFRDRSAIFDLNTRKLKTIRLKVWRDHAFFLDPAVCEAARKLIK